MALADAFDMAVLIKHDLQAVLKSSIPITMIIDSLSLFEVITKASSTTGKRSMIDLITVKDAYRRREIDTVGFVRTQCNPADALTKPSTCPNSDSNPYRWCSQRPHRIMDRSQVSFSCQKNLGVLGFQFI